MLPASRQEPSPAASVSIVRMPAEPYKKHSAVVVSLSLLWRSPLGFRRSFYPWPSALGCGCCFFPFRLCCGCCFFFFFLLICRKREAFLLHEIHHIRRDAPLLSIPGRDVGLTPCWLSAITRSQLSALNFGDEVCRNLRPVEYVTVRARMSALKK